MRLTGRVAKGPGVATSHLARCHEEIERRARMKLCPGTLNVELPVEVDLSPSPDFTIDGYRCNEADEWIAFQYCEVAGRSGLVMRTSTQTAGKSHPLSTIEVLTAEKLRDVLGLDIGDEIEVVADLRVMDSE